MRHVLFFGLLILLTGTIYFIEQTGPSAPVGMGAVMRLIADFQRQAERVPLRATRISDGEERQIGSRLANTYGLTPSRSFTDSESAAVEKYLNVVGRSLCSHVRRPSLVYHFYFNESPGLVNAYSLPGGYIVVGRGLFDIMQSEDELAAVLGHEIAHVDQRHCIERLQYEVTARKLGLSAPYVLASLPVALFQAGYTKERELEADRVGVALAVMADYSPQGSIDLFQRFQSLYEHSKQRSASPTAEISSVMLSGLGEYFRSHPPSAERVEEIEKEIRAHHWTRSSVKPLQERTSKENDTAENHQ